MVADLRTVAVARFAAFGPLGEREILDLASLAGRLRWLRRGEYVQHEGDPPSLLLLLRGWTASSMSFDDGTRQIVRVQLPGDMLGLSNLALRSCAESIIALTDIQLGVVDPQALGRLFSVNPRLGALLFLIAQEERVIGMDRLVSLSATEALNRVAALVRELHQRLQRIDPAVGDTFDAPLLQTDVAGLIGITAVHLSRTIKRLRFDRVLRWERRTITILDHAKLATLGRLPTREIISMPSWLPPSPGPVRGEEDDGADSFRRNPLS